MTDSARASGLSLLCELELSRATVWCEPKSRDPLAQTRENMPFFCYHSKAPKVFKSDCASALPSLVPQYMRPWAMHTSFNLTGYGSKKQRDRWRVNRPWHCSSRYIVNIRNILSLSHHCVSHLLFIVLFIYCVIHLLCYPFIHSLIVLFIHCVIHCVIHCHVIHSRYRNLGVAYLLGWSTSFAPIAHPWQKRLAVSGQKGSRGLQQSCSSLSSLPHSARPDRRS